MRANIFRGAFLVGAALVGAGLCGCAGTKYVYCPQERMVMLQSHNGFLEIGPCGLPWNYDDQVNILLPEKGEVFEAAQLSAYQNGKLKIDGGEVRVDRAHKTVMVDLTFEGYEHAEDVPVKCKYNGVHKYTERKPVAGEVTRKWLEDFYRGKDEGIYQR
jgi:hypothetical protein